MYISQAIESVLRQKCNDPIEIVIFDDCSTDGTSDICLNYAKNYPNTILYFRQENNVGLLENYRQLFKRCSGEYIAWLDGDDYWCDENKLQKQIRILKTGRYKICCSDRYIEKDGNIYLHPIWELNTLKNLLTQGNSICTPTVVCSKFLLDKYIDEVVALAKERNWKTVDFAIWANALYDYPNSVYFQSDITAVYRIVRGSGSHGESNKLSYSWDACVCDMINYYSQYLKYASLDVIEHIFHLRKRMLLNYGWIAREQIWPLLKILPYYPMIFYRSIIRKLKKN